MTNPLCGLKSTPSSLKPLPIPRLRLVRRSRRFALTGRSRQRPSLGFSAGTAALCLRASFCLHAGVTVQAAMHACAVGWNGLAHAVAEPQVLAQARHSADSGLIQVDFASTGCPVAGRPPLEAQLVRALLRKRRQWRATICKFLLAA